MHAAAGAIGGIAVQLCRMLGAEVAGTCRARNVEHVTALGAHRAIAYDREDFARAISGQDVVLDMIGGDVHTRSRRVLRPGGRLVWLIAEPFGEPDDGRDIEVRQATIEDSPETLAAVMRLAGEGRIRPLVSRGAAAPPGGGSAPHHGGGREHARAPGARYDAGYALREGDPKRSDSALRSS